MCFKVIIFAIISTSLTLAQIELCPGICKTLTGFEEFKITNKTILYSSYNLYWGDAMKKCQEMGGVLLNIENREQNAEVYEFVKKNHFQVFRDHIDSDYIHIWIGANDLDNHGDYRWKPSNKKLTYSSWAGNKPDNEKGIEHCVELFWIDKIGLYWNDEHCEYARRFMCELPFNDLT